jgi:hypothetical protein
METVEDIAKDNPTEAFCEIAPPRLWVTRKLPGSAKKSRWTPVWHNLYGGYTLRSVIEAPLITREVLHETYFLLVIIAADAQARPFLQFQASC